MDVRNNRKESGLKWTDLKDGSGRSLKWTVLSQPERSLRQKWWSQTIVVGLLSQIGRSFAWSLLLKVDGSKESQWTVQRFKSGRFKGIKVDGPKVKKWTLQRNQSWRSKGFKVNGPKKITINVNLFHPNPDLTVILIPPKSQFHPNPNLTLSSILPKPKFYLKPNFTLSLISF